MESSVGEIALDLKPVFTSAQRRMGGSFSAMLRQFSLTYIQYACVELPSSGEKNPSLIRHFGLRIQVLSKFPNYTMIPLHGICRINDFPDLVGIFKEGRQLRPVLIP